MGKDPFKDIQAKFDKYEQEVEKWKNKYYSLQKQYEQLEEKQINKDEIRKLEETNNELAYDNIRLKKQNRKNKKNSEALVKLAKIKEIVNKMD